MENLDLLIKELVKQPKETSWLEFKLNNDEPGMIGEDICALANSAALAGRDKAYFIWGVENETHDLKGTSFNWRTAKVGNEELENWLHHNLSANANFEFDSTQIGGNGSSFWKSCQRWAVRSCSKRKSLSGSGVTRKN